MIRIALICSLCLLSFCQAQQKSPSAVNEILLKLQRSKPGTSRVLLLNEIAAQYYKVSNEVKHPRAADSVAYYADIALSQSKAMGYTEGMGKSYILLSNAANHNKQEEKSKNYANQAIAVFSKKGKKDDLAEAYNALFEAVAMGNSAEDNLKLSEKVWQYYKESGNNIEEADALLSVADWLIELGRIKEGQAKINESVRLYRKVGNPQTQMAYSMLAMSYYQLGETEKAVEYAIACTKLIEKFHDQSEDAADMYNYQVSLYDFLNNKEKAYECLRKGYEIALKYNNPGLINGIESNMVKALINMGRKKEAAAILHTMEKKYPTLPLISKKIFVGRWVGGFLKMGDVQSAGKYVSDAVALSEASPPLDYVQNLLYPALATYYFKTENYPLAKKYAALYRQMGESNGNKLSISIAYDMLFKIDSVHNNFRDAIVNLKLYQKYKDELLNETKNKQIAELEIRYETAKKDRQNLYMKKQTEFQQTRITKLNTAKNVGLVAIFLLLVIAGLSYYNFRIKKKSNIQLQKQKAEIDHKNSVLNTLLDEKDWLLKEIHHRVKNNLQIVMSLLNTQSHYLKDEAATTAIKNSQHRIHSMALIHKKLYQSDNLVAIDMSVYIKELIDYLKSSFDTKQRIRFVNDIASVELDASQAVPLGLIINEAVTNAIKYAFPDEKDGIITITLKPTSESSYLLTIKDNGIGLESDFDIKKAKTLGLRLIKGLSTDIDAKLSIQSHEGLAIGIEFVFDEKIVVLKDISQEKLTA